MPQKIPEAIRFISTSESKYLLGLIKEIQRAKSKGYVIHSLILSSAILEEVFLPHLTEMVLSRLDILNKKSVFRREDFYTKNSLYFALTQDVKLFEKLDKYRKIRNKVIHKIFFYKSLKEVKRDADLGLKYFKDIADEIGKRLNGKTSIPVLAYYPKGWNDALKEAIKIVKKV